MTDDPEDWWDEAYEDDPPWDTGEPQSAFVRLVETGEIEGRVLDAGCGTGTEALYFAERGHDVTGVDFSSRAIERARAKARARDLDATFRVGDALDFDPDLGPFDTVVDSGLFHAFEENPRTKYADSLAGVLRPGGRAFVLSFGEDAPDDWGPNPVSEADVRGTFAGGEWRVRDIREVEFETIRPVPGCLAMLDRIRDGA